jgi:hypothetical protein
VGGIRRHDSSFRISWCGRVADGICEKRFHASEVDDLGLGQGDEGLSRERHPVQRSPMELPPWVWRFSLGAATLVVRDLEEKASCLDGAAAHSAFACRRPAEGPEPIAMATGEDTDRPITEACNVRAVYTESGRAMGRNSWLS